MEPQIVKCPMCRIESQYADYDPRDCPECKGLGTADVKNVTFSLMCSECDAGDGVDTEAQALAEGWTDIEYNDGPSWNFLGTCPACKAEEDKEVAELEKE